MKCHIWLVMMLTRATLSQVSTLLEEFGKQLINYRSLLTTPAIQHPSLDKDFEEYDFIVVGAGSAGCVVAARLSENPSWKVLLLEAGPPESPVGQIPMIGPILLTTQYGWDYKTTPQATGCFGKYNNQCYVRTGRSLGGSSAVNGIIYSRGNKQDYDIWASLGNPGWSYSEVLPYFKKSENVNLRHFDRHYHERGGPLNIEDPRFYTREMDAFLKAGVELGYKVTDYNGAEQIGVSMSQFLSMGGIRRSTSKAYLESKRRRNLVIKPLSHATRVVVNPHTKRAEGVAYERNGRSLTARSKREVILSAGSLNSPKLLMISGIGPKNDLEKLNIECLRDLQVGRNLMDHVSFAAMNFYYDHAQQPNYVQDFLEWVLYGAGSLSSGGVDALAYLRTPLSSENQPPDVELLLLPSVFNQGYKIIKELLNVEKKVHDSTWGANGDKTGFTILILLARPKSVGVLSLRSNDSFDAPLIDPRYLSHASDVETLLEGIRIVTRFATTRSMKRLGARLSDRQVHGCEGFDFGSDDYWRCAIRIMTISGYHYMSTCKMGPPSDAHAVVDNYLKVYGVKNLRIADSSVIPHGITSHLEATAVMIGERVADFIKNDWTNM